MENKNSSVSVWMIIGLIASIAAIVASLTTALIFFEKKKRNDEELEEYLDCCIQ